MNAYEVVYADGTSEIIMSYTLAGAAAVAQAVGSFVSLREV